MHLQRQALMLQTLISALTLLPTAFAQNDFASATQSACSLSPARQLRVYTHCDSVQQQKEKLGRWETFSGAVPQQPFAYVRRKAPGGSVPGVQKHQTAL
jgi:hypothetical protein